MKVKDCIQQYEFERNRIKKRLFIAVSVLVALSAIVVAVSYAWVTISLSPTVENVATTVSSNGALEIALLTSDTYNDTSKIRAGIGTSTETVGVTASNITWGNLVDLGDESYGLDKINLYPSLLNINRYSSGDASIGDGILQVPVFGYDGRLKEMDKNSVSGILENDLFIVDTEYPTHGVRAIGTADTLSLQQKAIIASRSNMASSNNISKQSAEILLDNCGSVCFDLLNKHRKDPASFIYYQDIESLIALISETKQCLNNIDFSLRQALTSIIASVVEDETEFEEMRVMLSDTDVPLEDAIYEITVPFQGEAALTEWIVKIAELQEELTGASLALSEMQGGALEWGRVLPIIGIFVDTDKIYYSSEPFESAPPFVPGCGIVLLPNSGAFSFIAEFVGEYGGYPTNWSGEFEQFGHDVTIKGDSDGGNLTRLQNIIKELDAANNSVRTAVIGDICGFAIDFAFKVNADDAYLLLKPSGIYDAMTNPNPWDGGSYMDFSSGTLQEEELFDIMNAFRITFVDSTGKVLGMAKLDTEDYRFEDDKYRAPIYLFEYSEGENSIDIGENIGESAPIAKLPVNKPLIVTAIIWLDGNHITNSMIGSVRTDIEAKMNIQFITNVELVPSLNQ